MKKHIRSVVVAATLCLLPILFLSPLLFGAAAQNCNFTPFNGPCNYSAGCSLTIEKCSTYNNQPDVCTSHRSTKLATNFFSCVSGTPTQSCDPVLESDGIAATTTCLYVYYPCAYNQKTGACTQGPQSGTCDAPYYQSGTCPKG
jgi:hypothetical protein